MSDKERITITIDKKILRKIDAKVDGHSIRNRSHAIEGIIINSLGKLEIDTAVILAGGMGTKLRPITYEIPKAMIPIHDKPILEHQIEMLKNNGITNIILSIGFKAEKIFEYFGNGENFGVSIKYIKEKKPMGTAGAITLAKKHLLSTFVVMNVDTIINPDVSKLYKFHKENNATATLTLIPAKDPQQSGVVELEGNKIISFREKPKNIDSALINAGFYIMEPSIKDTIPRGKSMLEKDVFPVVAKNNMLYGYPFNGEFFDIGSPKGFETAVKKWKGY